MPHPFVVTAMLAVSPFTVSLVDVDKRVGGESPSWEEWTFNLSNTTATDRNFSVCPRDIDRIAHDPANTTMHAFAIGFDDDARTYGCTETVVPAGESIRLRVYTRPYGRRGSGRTLVIRDSDGAIVPPVQ